MANVSLCFVTGKAPTPPAQPWCWSGAQGAHEAPTCPSSLPAAWSPPWRCADRCCFACRNEADHLAEYCRVTDGDLWGLPEESCHAHSWLQLQPHRSEREVGHAHFGDKRGVRVVPAPVLRGMVLLEYWNTGIVPHPQLLSPRNLPISSRCPSPVCGRNLGLSAVGAPVCFPPTCGHEPRAGALLPAGVAACSLLPSKH